MAVLVRPAWARSWRCKSPAVHVHVRAGSSEAKLWLKPQVRVADSHGFDAGTLRELVEVAQANGEMIERAWHDYFG